MAYIEWIRSLVGQRRIFLAFTSLVIFDRHGRILLQHRTDFKVWGLPGGSLERGETILDCARRELQEETGLTCGKLELVGIYSDPHFEATYPNGDQVQQYTICLKGTVAGGRLQADGLEGSELRFFAPAELPIDSLPAYYQAMLTQALEGGPPAFLSPFARSNLIDQIGDIRPVIGKALYIAVGAVGVTVNPAGELLMVKRAETGEWEFPGGHMDLGENVAHTVIREIREETGIDVIPERILGVFSPALVWEYPNGDQTQPVVTIFRCRPNGGAPCPDQHETIELAWMAPETVRQLPVNPISQQLFKAILQHLEAGYFIL